MAGNEKLTKIIAGRTIKSVQQSDATMTVQFTDGSTMRIKLASPTNSVMVRDAKAALEYMD